MNSVIRIQNEAFDPAAEIARLAEGGASVSFVGRVRAEDGVTALRLEHYPGMTEREIAKLAEEAQRQWPLLGVTVIHRTGELKPGEAIVLVAVTAEHRREAFAACEFLMDRLKTEAPFWKLEKKGAASAWVEAKASDDAAAQRWSK
jgi:molybdopterin synthase catalytic subunit